MGGQVGQVRVLAVPVMRDGEDRLSRRGGRTMGPEERAVLMLPEKAVLMHKDGMMWIDTGMTYRELISALLRTATDGSQKEIMAIVGRGDE